MRATSTARELPGRAARGKSGAVKVAADPERFVLVEVATPLGGLLCVADVAGVLRVVDWADCPDRFGRLLRRHCGATPQDLVACDRLSTIRAALDAYFAGQVGALDDVEVGLVGTEFQHAVWRVLRGLRPGETISYAELASRAGRPGASRAAGAANGANPISLIVPCHRAIGSNGELTGYAGGLARKRWLLAHERAALGRAQADSGTSTAAPVNRPSRNPASASFA